jgi:hypothetical protein
LLCGQNMYLTDKKADIAVIVKCYFLSRQSYLSY